MTDLDWAMQFEHSHPHACLSKSGSGVMPNKGAYVSVKISDDINFVAFTKLEDLEAFEKQANGE